jgi:hypothetical protein
MRCNIGSCWAFVALLGCGSTPASYDESQGAATVAAPTQTPTTFLVGDYDIDQLDTLGRFTVHAVAGDSVTFSLVASKPGDAGVYAHVERKVAQVDPNHPLSADFVDNGCHASITLDASRAIPKMSVIFDVDAEGTNPACAPYASEGFLGGPYAAYLSVAAFVGHQGKFVNGDTKMMLNVYNPDDSRAPDKLHVFLLDTDGTGNLEPIAIDPTAEEAQYSGDDCAIQITLATKVASVQQKGACEKLFGRALNASGPYTRW